MDKARSGFPIAVDFYDGEMPTAAKLRGLSRQAKNGISLLEYAIGDPWNQSGDQILNVGGTSTDNALMIANLSRFVGAAKYLNPYWRWLYGWNYYTHVFAGSSDVGKHEAILSVPTQQDITWYGTNCPNNRRDTKGTVRYPGDYYVDSDGYIYCYDEIREDWKATYYPIVLGEAYTDQNWSTCTHNIIPDPDTHTSYGFRGCKIAYTNNTDNSEGYIVYLPPRGPLATRRLASTPQDIYTYANIYNMHMVPDDPTLTTAWQRGSTGDVAATNILTAPYYRYNLPKVVTDNWSAASTIPTGLVYLWDHAVTQTIINGVTLSAENIATPSIWCFIVTGTAMETWVTNNMTACGYPPDALTARDNHSTSYYPANGLRVITVGSSLAQVVDNLVVKFYNHDHHSGGLPTRRISHSHLLDLHDTASFLPSESWTNDDHPQYLHRWGARYSPYSRDESYGGMFGDLLMCSTVADDYYLNLSGDSQKIIFGQISTGPQIYFEYANSILAITKKSLRIEGRLMLGPLGTRTCPNISFTDNTDEAYLYQVPAEAGGLSVSNVSSLNGTYAKEGGKLHCNRYYAGSYYDTGAGGYGYSGTSSDEWGHIRVLTIPAQDFTFHKATNASVSGETLLAPSNCGLYAEEASYGDGLTSFYGRLEQPASTLSNYALAPIRLPYAKYTIVNIVMGICPINAQLASGKCYAAIIWLDGGYWTQNILPGDAGAGYNKPWAEFAAIAGTYEVDLNTKFPAADVLIWTTPVALYDIYSGTPLDLTTSDFSSVGGDLGKWKLPFVRLRCPGDAYTQNGFLFSTVNIFYRIQEF